MLRIEYPSGSFSKATGGAQFYSVPLETNGTASEIGGVSSDGQYERMLLSYDIWFPDGFQWVDSHFRHVGSTC